jgi:hypothetical protein
MRPPSTFVSFHSFAFTHLIYDRKSSKDAEAVAAKTAKEYGVKTKVRDILIFFRLKDDADCPLIDSC